ncbi:hypothetical protein niasHT_027626 [Heterodera trifolii]|uniref:Uncharacterized protein n=1 Tax=Heterodera trifolii TaxID=157864 RepID=A0ABD2K5B5_9BILA
MNYNAELAEQFPGWPYAYKQITGMYLFEGVSNEFPYVAACPVSPSVYLIPASIGFVASLQLLSKSQRSKTQFLGDDPPSLLPPTPEEYGSRNRKSPVSVIVSKDPTDFIVKQMFYESFNDPCHFILMDRDGIVTYCLFSDVREPVRCYVYGYSMATVAQEFLNGTKWIPNVVYEGRVQCKFAWDFDAQTGRVTNLRSHYEFNKIIRFAQPGDNPRAYKALVDLAVRDAKYFATTFGHPACVKFLTKPPTIRFKAVSLWYFGDSILLSPARPRRLSRVSPGLHVDCNSPMFYDIEPDMNARKLPLPPIREGQRIIANLWHNKLNNFYLVHSYVLAEKFKQPGERDDHYQLPVRLQLGTSSASDTPSTSSASETTSQFLVNVNNSIFKDFYSCEQLGFSLISDPRRLLRNATHLEHLDGFPVWISAVQDEFRLARFAIMALAYPTKNYSRLERSGRHPDIHGHGILIVSSTGIVFSKDHPQTHIRLLPADRRYVSVGDQFIFTATFYDHNEGFIVCGIQLLDEEDEEQFIELDSIKLGGDDILFVQKLKTHMRQWAAEGHDSPNFGPVADPKELVTDYVCREEIQWPENIEVLVCFNTEWMQGADTLMKVHSLVIDGEFEQGVKEKIESMNNDETSIASPATLSLQQEDNDGAQVPARTHSEEEEECGCLEVWGILRELLEDERATSELEPEMIQGMVELRNSFPVTDRANNQ